ncbi:MAG: hypothetical protein KGL35_00365 [Bradyrhizobium sp.]|nr:hypothetical protein [Bradyrhizobium sp.]
MATALGPQNLYIGKGLVGVNTAATLVNYWQPSTVYAVGDQVINFNDAPGVGEYPFSVYQCTAAGTSAASAGPTGTGSAIADGTLVSAATSAAAAAGTNVLTFASVPAGVNVGMLSSDVTASAAIPAGTTVTAKTGTTVTLSNAIVSPGVGSGDTIDFPGVTWAYSAFTDVGEVSAFKTKITDSRDDYFTNRSGNATVIESALTKRECEVTATFKEFTIENIALAAFGAQGGVAPHRYVKVGQSLPANIVWQFVGTGAYGQHFQVVVPRMQLMPGELDWIGEKFLDMNVTGKIFAMPSDGYAFYYAAEIP